MSELTRDQALREHGDPICFRDGFAVHQGDRGESVALLLLTLARVVGAPDHGGHPREKCRFFDIALLRLSCLGIFCETPGT